MKHLKIVAKGFAGYNGSLGMVQFKDGVSVDPVPRIYADRISASISVVEVGEDGQEVPAGIANRLIGGATMQAVSVALTKATQEELDAEQKRLTEIAGRPPVEHLYTVKQLEEVATEKGINGLREIAKPWGVKDRSIPGLIKEILTAQGEFEKAKAARAAALAPAPDLDVVMEGFENEAQYRLFQSSASKVTQKMSEAPGEGVAHVGADGEIPATEVTEPAGDTPPAENPAS